MTSLSLTVDPFQSGTTVPKALIEEALTHSFSTDLDYVPNIEDFMIFPARIGHRAFLDVEIAVVFDFHAQPLQRSLVRSYLIHLMCVEQTESVGRIG